MNKKTPFIYSAPMKETPATLNDVIIVKTALAALLIEETSLMDSMQIEKVGQLQERKLKLIGLLERYTRYLTQHQEVLAHTTQEEKATLKITTENFNKAMQKNYDTLLVARAVNGAIVKCVTQNVTKKDNNPIYNARGATGKPYHTPISVTLNQTI